MFEWIENYMETFDCDWETAAREYHALNDSDYEPEDWE